MRRIMMVFLAALLAGSTVQADDLAPQPQTLNGVTFVSGGIGEGKETMLAMKNSYNLHLQFTDKEGAYLADVKVSITDAKGASVIDAVSDGPFFYAQLKPGKYKVTATSDGEEQAQGITLSAKGAVAKAFYFKKTETP